MLLALGLATPAAGATAAATTVVVGARNRRLRRAAEGRQEPLFD
ncbi:hypothetical protein SMCF_7155 [Streptomyces coelicoflavus ZG0656]|nr:hypothetical protein SMCF_7155 [Streptomyces coelicoflavus ZG0656]